MCRDRPGRLSRRPVAVGAGAGGGTRCKQTSDGLASWVSGHQDGLGLCFGVSRRRGWKHLAELCARAIDFDSILQLNKIILNFNTVVRSISESSQSSIFLCGVMSLSVK